MVAPNLTKYKQVRNISTGVHKGIGKVIPFHAVLLLFDSM